MRLYARVCVGERKRKTHEEELLFSKPFVFIFLVIGPIVFALIPPRTAMAPGKTPRSERAGAGPGDVKQRHSSGGGGGGAGVAPRGGGGEKREAGGGGGGAQREQCHWERAGA